MIQVSRFQLWSALVVVVLGLLFAGPNVLPKDTVQHFPSYVPHQQFNLGLDLRGGAYLLLEADMRQALDEHLKDMRNQNRQKLRAERGLRYEELRPIPRGVSFRVTEAASVDKALEVANTVARDLGGTGGLFARGSQRYEVRAEGSSITLRLTDAGIASIQERILEQAMEILRRRIDPDGTKEVTIQRQGSSKVIVEVPGVSDTDEIKQRIGTTAKMTFHLVHPSIVSPNENTPPPPGYKLVKGAKGEEGWYLVREDPEL